MQTKKELAANVIRGALGLFAVLALILGQVRMLNGLWGPAAGWSLAGVLLGVLAWVWTSVAGVFSALSERRKALAAKKPARAAAGKAAGAKASKGAPAGGLKAFLSALLERFPDQIDLPRWLYLSGTALLLAATQWFWLRGSMAMGFIALFFSFLPAAVFLQDRERPISLPHLRHNLVTLLWLLPGLPFQFFGAMLLWQYQYVFTGYALEALGGFYWLWVLWKRPFNLELEDDEPQLQLHTPPPTPFYTRGRVITKLALLGGAILLALVARPLYLNDRQGVALLVRSIAIILLLGSFPWLPYAAGSLPGLPQGLRPWLALGGLIFAFLLGVVGQGRIEGGQVGAGLSWFLAGAIVLILSVAPGDPERKPASEGWLGTRMAKGLEIAAVLGLVALAFYHRFHNIEIFPYTAEGDEAAGGLLAWDILFNRVENQLVHQNIPLFPFQVTSAFFHFFGLSVGTMRWHSVFFGTVSVVSTYFFLRLFSGRLVAYASTFLMAMAYWHLHYSRFGHYNIEQVAYQMAAFYFVFKGLRDRDYRAYVAGGLAFGFAMLPHLSSRLLPFGAIGLLLYWFASRRQVLRKHFTGLLAFVLAAWILAAPSLTYWARVIPLSMGRAQSVSIFDRSNTNAPKDLYAGLVANIKSSVMMFNLSSDSRPRNNPIAPDKILERWTATAFLLALLYVIYHWRQPLNFFLGLLFSIILSASVFSVEAPQTLRTAGNIGLVFAIIAMPLMDLRRHLAAVPRGIGALALAALLVPSFSWFGYKSWHKYFVERAHQQFDVLPTLIAERAGKAAGTNTQAVFFASGFGAGHPPVTLFRKEVPIRNYYDFTEALPIFEQWGMDHLVFFADEYKPAAPWFKQLYPGAVEEVYKDPRNGDEHYILYTLTHEERKKAHGLAAEASVGGRTLRLEGQPLAWPLPGLEGATRVRFSGTLNVVRTAEWVPALRGAGRASFRLDGRPWGPGRGVVPMGLHSFEVDFQPDGAKVMQAVMDAPAYNNGLFFNKRGPGAQDLNEAVLLRSIKPQGWYMRYYTNTSWEGKPITELIQPMIHANWLDSPLPGQWSALGKARLRVDSPGVYSFSTPTPAYGEVWVNGKFVNRYGAAPMILQRPPALGSIQLGKGWHDLEYRFSTGGNPWMHLNWNGPDGNGPLLPDRLLPVLP